MFKIGGVVKMVNGVKKIVGGFLVVFVSFMFILGMFCLFLVMLVGILFVKKYGIKIVNMIVVIIYGFFIFGLMMIGKGLLIWILWFFGGVFFGVMNGVFYLIFLINVIKWFLEKKGLIFGICVVCYGFGFFVFKYIVMWVVGGNGVINVFNIGCVFFWWGILVLVLVVVGFLLLKDVLEVVIVLSVVEVKFENVNFLIFEMLYML